MPRGGGVIVAVVVIVVVVVVGIIRTFGVLELFFWRLKSSAAPACHNVTNLTPKPGITSVAKKGSKVPGTHSAGSAVPSLPFKLQINKNKNKMTK